jgi:glucose-6-phosphate dehydrogenase assembly protein OpcA
MVTQNTAENLGSPVPVDVAAIEHELESLWKSASPADGEPAVIRACSCNLVVIADGRADTADVLPVLARVAEWRPARYIVAFRETSKEARLDAWISAQCSLPILGRPQICSEAIAIAATDSTAPNLPDTVLSLLVPDLPVYLYWRSFREPDWAWIERIARFSSLLIIDSHHSKDDPENRHRVLRLLADAPPAPAVRDLNWSRLTAWRDLVAQFFDHPAFAGDARQIAEVEVCRALGAPGNLPTRTLLLTGWLASRLGWKRTAVERTSDEWISRWQGASGEVTVRFTGRPTPSGEPEGISAITLRTRTGNTFSVTRDSGSSVLKAAAQGKGPALNHSVPQTSMDEAALLVGELSLSGEDAVFRAALSEALAIEMATAQS